MKKIVILIPAYNEESKIGEVISNIPKTILGIKTEVLVIDDGSSDNTVIIAKKNKALIISHSRNLGLGRTFQTGLEKALELNASYLVNIDADGQFDSSEIEMLITPLINNKADFCSGNRFRDNKIPKNMPKEKFWGNILMTKLISFLANEKFEDVSCGFRAYNRKAMLSLNLTGKFTYTQESFLDLATKGIRILQVPVKVKYIKGRKSKISGNLFSYGCKTLKIIIRSFRDYRPLLFFFYLGLLTGIPSLMMGLYLLLHFLNTGTFTPYKYLGFAFIYFSTMTIILWVIGFLADMFARLRMNQEKILYIEKKRLYGK